MIELDLDLHNLRLLAVSVVARRRGMRPSGNRVRELLGSGLSRDSTLQLLMQEQGFLSKWFWKLKRWLAR